MQRLVVQVALLRWGVRRWESKVNGMLADGWKLLSHSVEKKGLRIVCVASLWRDKNASR